MGDLEKEKGNAAFREGDYAKALKHYDNAIKKSGSGAGAVLFANKAAALIKLEKFDPCIQQCHKGLAAPGLTPELKTKIYLRMATAYESQAKFKNAVEALKNCDPSPTIAAKISELSAKFFNGDADIGTLSDASVGQSLKQIGSSGEGKKQTTAELILEHNQVLAQFKERLGNSKVPLVRGFRNTPALDRVCTTPLCDLKPISIDQMSSAKAYVGKVLICRTIVDSIPINVLHTLIEDPRGAVVRLSIYNLMEANALPNGTYLAIKEPWYMIGVDGTRTLRVDSPQNLAYLEQSHDLLRNVTWRSDVSSVSASSVLKQRSWESFQKRGNELFVAGIYEHAIIAYTDAIELKQTIGLQDCADLLANRAAAFSECGKLEKAICDCRSALVGQPGHLKATFRMAIAKASLGKYEEAKDLLEKSPYTTRPEVKNEIARLNRLTREQQNGDYDLQSMLKEAAASKTPRLDHTDYNGGVEVQFISKQKGNGLVAMRDFEPGDLLFVCKAFEATYRSECATTNDAMQNECASRITRRMLKEKDLVKEFYRLYAGPKFERFEDVCIIK